MAMGMGKTELRPHVPFRFLLSLFLPKTLIWLSKHRRGEQEAESCHKVLHSHSVCSTTKFSPLTPVPALSVRWAFLGFCFSSGDISLFLIGMEKHKGNSIMYYRLSSSSSSLARDGSSPSFLWLWHFTPSLGWQAECEFKAKFPTACLTHSLLPFCPPNCNLLN